MAKSDLIAVLDIGTYKVVCLIASIGLDRKIEIKGIGHQLSRGIKSGVITDVSKAESCILAAINSAEKMARANIEEVAINISGSIISSSSVEVELSVSGHEITQRDISNIINTGYSHFSSSDKEIIHSITMDYTIDNLESISNPIGMYGENLKTDIHVISCSSTAKKNLINCLAKCHLDVRNLVVSPYMSGLSTLSYDEKKIGVIHIDIGAGTTSISIFKGGYCIYVSSINIGGNHITMDIAKGLSISIEYAERIKTIYGTVIVTDRDVYEKIDIPITELQSDIDDEAILSVGDSYLSKVLLTSIIKPRMEEILEMVKENIENSGFYNQTGPRVVFSGGGSQLMGLKELAGHIFNKHIRVGKPISFEGIAESYKGPEFSTAVGMLIYISNEVEKSAKNSLVDGKGNKKTSSKLINWFKDNF